MTVKELMNLLSKAEDVNKPVAFLVFFDKDSSNTAFKPVDEAKLGRAYIGEDGRPYHFPASSEDAVVVAVQPWAAK